MTIRWPAAALATLALATTASPQEAPPAPAEAPAAGGLLGFLGYHYATTGRFSPHIWAGFVGGSFGFVGIITLVIGLVGDMLVRIRTSQDRILYMLRDNHR